MNLKRNTVTALRNVLKQCSTIRSSWEILYYYFEEIQPTSLMLQKYDGYWTPRIMSTKSGNSKRRNPNKVRTHFSRIRIKRAGSRKIKQNVFSRWNIMKNCWRLCLEQHHSAQIILLQDDLPRSRFSEEGLDHHNYHHYHPDHHHHHHYIQTYTFRTAWWPTKTLGSLRRTKTTKWPPVSWRLRPGASTSSPQVSWWWWWWLWWWWWWWWWWCGWWRIQIQTQ